MNVFAASTFLEVFFLLLIFIPLLLLWAFSLVDLFRRRDLSGLAAAAWLLFIVFLPIFGALVYVTARPGIRDFGDPQEPPSSSD